MTNPYAPPPRGPRATGDDAGQDAGVGAQDTGTGTGTGTGEAPHGSSRSTPPGTPRPAGAQASPPQGPPDPTRPPPDPDAVRGASRQVMHFGLIMLASLVTAALPLPWQAAALVFALGAIVVGIRAMRAVWRSGVRGALVPVLGVGLVFAALMSISLATMLALWPLQVQRQDCLRDALTISAREACEVQFQDALTERLAQWGQGSTG